MRRKTLALSLLLVISNLCFSQVDSIYNISISQRTDGSEIVDIYYDLAGSEYYYNIEFQVSFDTGTIFTAIDSIMGDFGIGVQPDTGKHAIWIVGEEYPGEYYTDALLKVIANTEYITCGESKFHHEGLEYGTILYEGRCWLDRNLGALQVAAHELDSLSFGDTYQWGRLMDGHQIVNSDTTSIKADFIIPGHNKFIIGIDDWQVEPSNNLWQGPNGINNPCPTYFRVPTSNEWGAVIANFYQFFTDLKIPWSGSRSGFTGNYYWEQNILYAMPSYWSSTIENNQSYLVSWDYYFPYGGFSSRINGHHVRCINNNTSYIENVENISPLNGSIQISEFVVISWNHTDPSVKFDVFFGKDSIPPLVEHKTSITFYEPDILEFNTKYFWRIVSIYNDSVAISSDIWSFTTRDFTCGSSIVQYEDEIYGTVEYIDRCWFDRNLGAIQAATSHIDQAAYGDYFQWGRLMDGHEDKFSLTTSSLSSDDNPGHGDFILEDSPPFDWRSPQNDTLWNGETLVNNPCPEGWNVPSINIWQTASNSWISQLHPFESLKLVYSGYRSGIEGSLDLQNAVGFYWSRSPNISNGYANYLQLIFSPFGKDSLPSGRSNGYSIRCIKNEPIDIPDNPFPLNNSVVPTKHIDIKWSSCYHPDGDSIFYDIFFSLDSIPSLLVSGYSDTAYNLGELDYGSTYFWKIIVRDKYGAKSNSDLWTFKVDNFNCGSTFIELNDLQYGTVEYVGYCWLDRNLGASRVAQSIDDTLSYGSYYQWGRLTDGHEYPYSEMTYTLASNFDPGHDDFILFDEDPLFTHDWLNPQNDTLWNGISKTNNPCPDNWVVPDANAWQLAIDNLPDPSNPWSCPLKIPFGGYRSGWNIYDGDLLDRGTYGIQWSSASQVPFTFYSNGADPGSPGNYFNGNGNSVRCIKQWRCGDKLFDDRDGQSYNTVQIGDQCWMAENLNIGSDISSTINQTNNSTIEKYCYNDLTVFCSIFGGLYQWNEMMQYTSQEGTKGICPFGWHVPMELEWGALVSQLGYYVAGMEMKSTSGWHNDGNGINSSGFTGLPGGARGGDAVFYDFTKYGYFWTSSQFSTENAWSRILGYNLNYVFNPNDFKTRGISVRCLKD